MRIGPQVFSFQEVSVRWINKRKARFLCKSNQQRNRALPNYIYNERDPRAKKTYGGRRIDWYNWNEYYPGFACRCAEKAKAQGYDLFGVQFYGEI